jgi:hypothetical protein
MNQQQLLQRLRESIYRMTRAPSRIADAFDEAERETRVAVRALARQRVSHLLRQLRASLGLSYADVQQITGLTQQLLFDVEFKDRRLKLEELHLLAACYHVTADDILGIDLDPYAPSDGGEHD